MDAIGRLSRVELRTVWAYEDRAFTPWLKENLDVLSEVTGLDLVSAEREQAAGSFSVDLVAKDRDGRHVVIENQYGRSNHDHLGKLITYMVAFEAASAVWIVEDPRAEHTAAISWLNEVSPNSFYLVKVEAVRIGDSQPAPLLTLIIGPSDESKQVGDAKKEWAEQETLCHRFWESLLERAKSLTSLHSNISPSRNQWVGTSAGIPGALNYVVRQHNSNVELYIDLGHGETVNEAVFDAIYEHKDQVEAAIGAPLLWERLPNRRACRIKLILPQGGYRSDESEWPAIHDSMIRAMIRLEGALRPWLTAIDLKAIVRANPTS